MYYKKADYDKALNKFEESLEILNNVNLGNSPMAIKLKENIEFLKKEQQKKEERRKFLEYWK